MRRWNRLWDVVLGVIVSLLCAFPVSAREKVILDSDMVEGFDDGVAMLALAQSPGIELIGVTIVAGNTWVSDGVAYALRQLEIAGQNIPVAAGVDRPFRPQRYELFGLERQLFGMGHDAWVGAFGYPKPESWQKVYRERYGKEPQSRPDPRHAVDFIIEEVRKHPGELTIVEIGPCSNLALAVLKAPDIVPLIKRVIFMGGSFFKPGNVTPTAEFNWWFDPEAARIVVRTPFREQIMVGLDVCEKMPFSFDRYQAFLAGQRPEMKKLLESTYAVRQGQGLQPVRLGCAGSRDSDRSEPDRRGTYMRRGRERGIRAILRTGAGLSRQRAAGKPKSPDRHDDRSGTLLEHADGTLNRSTDGL